MNNKLYFLAILSLIAFMPVMAQNTEPQKAVPKKFQVDNNYQKYLSKNRYDYKNGVYVSLTDAAINKQIHIGVQRYISKKLVGELGILKGFGKLESTTGAFETSLINEMNYFNIYTSEFSLKYADQISNISVSTKYGVSASIKKFITGYPIASNYGLLFNIRYGTYGHDYTIRSRNTAMDTTINTSYTRMGFNFSSFFSAKLFKAVVLHIEPFGFGINMINFKKTGNLEDVLDGESYIKPKIYSNLKLVYAL